MINSCLIADPSGSAIGYVFVFALCALVFFVILAVPSLRKYRRKRNLIIYAAMGIILSSFIVQAYETSLRPPMFTVGIANSSEILPLKTDQTNQINFTCTTYCGDISASFYLVFKGVNVSFIGNQPDYILTDTATIKIPFTSSIGRDVVDIRVKPLSFQINENVTRFQLYPNIEEINGRVIWGSAYWDIWGNYNSTEQSYRIIQQQICQ
jgi:hypothetical protein